jgi:POT family proton-dependent oligopeptide transporter
MTTLLTLYLVNHLLLPGHLENVLGFGVLRSVLESVFGPMTTLALASLIFGLYRHNIVLNAVLVSCIRPMVQ